MRRHGLQRMAVGIKGVGVWQASLRAGKAQLDLHHGMLSSDEQRRAARFKFPADRRRFIVARALLRRLLAAHTGTPPETLAFRYNRHGKPLLRGFRGLHFNLSHSGERAVYALCASAPVGVDIEYFNRDTRIEAVARRFFAPAEFAVLEKITPIRRRRAFFSLWTCKEAVVKANGKGLAFQLSAFEVIGAGNAKPVIGACTVPALRKANIATLNAGPRYAAAVACIPSNPHEPSVRRTAKSKPHRT